MVVLYDKRSPGDSGRHIPLHVAQQLVDQRNELMEEVQKLRRDNDQLRSALTSAEQENKTLQRRATEAEELAREVQQYLREHFEAEKQPANGEEIYTEQISRLSRRVQELTTDLERVQRRSSEQLSDARRQERSRLLAGLGDVLDSIERGLQSDTPGPWKQGLQAIHDQLMSFLRAEGAVLTGQPGEEMNPHIHQAIATEKDPEYTPGQIIDVLRHGIALEDGTIVRPAQVVVAG